MFLNILTSWPRCGIYLSCGVVRFFDNQYETVIGFKAAEPSIIWKKGPVLVPERSHF